MDDMYHFAGATEAEVWQQIATHLASQSEPLLYSASVKQAGRRVEFVIDVDLGGGFEGGYSTTTFSAAVPASCPLRFTLHDQDWVSELGKLLGLEDIKLGYPELDEALIVKTNHPDKLRALLAPAELRATLLKHREAELTLHPTDEHDATAPLRLQFFRDEAIFDVPTLQEIYHLVYTLADVLTLTQPTTTAPGPHSA